MQQLSNPTVFSKLLSPLLGELENNPYYRSCHGITDTNYLEMGILRVLSDEESGRGFLQKLFHSGNKAVGVTHFFLTLKSSRRQNLIRHTLSTLLDKMKKTRLESDPFKNFKELDDFDLYSGDGHYHKASTHEDYIEGKKYAPEHFYSQNLRTHALNHLCLAESSQETNRKKEHDTRALKRLDIKTLRQGAPQGAHGKKVLYVWDPACLDFPQWDKWKYQSGVYFLSRNKENLKFRVEGKNSYDKDDSVNKGVVSDEMVTSRSGVNLRRVIYKCPFKNKMYCYLTNLHKKVRPGIIAFLYKTRWDIEKAFYQIKTKMHERKAWAKNANAKTSQALFICLAHNLTLLLEDEVEKEEDVSNDQDKVRSKNRLNQNLINSKLSVEKISLMLKTATRLTQRPFKFFRWLRAHLFEKRSWTEAVEALRTSYRLFA